MSKNFTIYVLRLISNKYYIGKSDLDPFNKEQIINKHSNEIFSEWTTKYKTIEIIESFESDCPFIEDQTTKKYMNNHGIDNVRGGSYNTCELPEWQIKALEHELTLIKKSVHVPKPKPKPKYDYFDNMDLNGIKEEIKFITETINSISNLNFNIVCSNFGGVNNEFKDLRTMGGSRTIVPSIITHEEMLDVIEYFDNLINYNSEKILTKFNSIFNKRENYNVDIDYFSILYTRVRLDGGINAGSTNMCINRAYMEERIKNVDVLKQTLTTILSELDYNINQRLEIRDILFNFN